MRVYILPIVSTNNQQLEIKFISYNCDGLQISAIYIHIENKARIGTLYDKMTQQTTSLTTRSEQSERTHSNRVLYLIVAMMVVFAGVVWRTHFPFLIG